MFDEDDLLPISALQHLSFCERQWGLIHLEGIWGENRLTAEGRHLHERADSPETEIRCGIRTARGLRLRSLRLGLSGKADVVEFHRIADTDGNCGVHLDGVAGLWQPVPVEYKRGKPRLEPCDEIQICAQALCIEEMLGARIPEGVLFYGATRRRYDVLFDSSLREKTEKLCIRLHALSKAGKTPSAKYEKKCDSCSLVEHCMPKTTGRRAKVEKYLMTVISGD